MENLLDKTKLRQLEIVEYLYYHNDWVSLAEVADQMEISTRTVQSDLEQLENQFEDLSFALEGKKIRLYFAEHANLWTLHSQMLQQNRSFSVLEYIILNDKAYFDDIREHFYVSDSTMYRRLNDVEAILKKSYHIQLQRAPLALVGDEENIRFLYLQYYLERYSAYEWPFLQMSEQLIEEFVLLFAEGLHIQLDYATLYKLKVVVAINAKRIKEQHLIYTRHNYPKHPFVGLKRTSQFKRYLELLLSSRYHDFWLAELTYPYAQADFAANYVDLLSKTTESPMVQEQFSAFSLLLDQMTADYELYLSNKQEVLLGMYNTLVFDGRTNNMPRLFYNYGEDLLKYFSEHFSEFTGDFERELRRMNAVYQFDLTEDELFRLMYTVITTWRHLVSMLTDSASTIEIVVISRFGVDHSRMLMDMLNLRLPANVNVEVFHQFPLTIESLEALSCDLLVVNFHLPPLNDKRVIAVSSGITTDDINRLTDAIRELI